MTYGKKNAYAEAIKQRIVHVLPEKDRYGLWHGRPYPHICKELRVNFIDGIGTLQGKLSGKTIKYHEGATHLNSSQVLCINFFNKFFKNEQSEELLLQILRDAGLDISDGEKIKDATLEYEPDRKERTNFDFFLQLTSGRHISFEVKYTESEFGGISPDRKCPEKYAEKWKYIYLPMVQKSPYLGECCDENLFYKHYQIHRNIAYARPEDIVIFLTPRNNHALDEECRYIDEFCTPNIRNLYWEDIVAVVFKAVQSNPDMYDYFRKFQDKYFPEDLEELVMAEETGENRFKDRIRKAYSEEQAEQILQVLDNGKKLRDLLLGAAKCWPYAGDYVVGNHTECKGTTTDMPTEKRICRCLYYFNSDHAKRCDICKYRQGRCRIEGDYRIKDYEVPAYYDGEGIGEIDLLIEGPEGIYATEVKPPQGNSECILRMITEILTYTLDSDKGYRKAIAFFENTPQSEEYRALAPKVKELLIRADIAVFQFVKSGDAYTIQKLR